MEVAVLLYPGCIFFEVALAVDTLSAHCPVKYYTPDGKPHVASNQATVHASGDLQALQEANCRAVLVPGGDPHSILVPVALASPALRTQAERGALIASICAGNLFVAAAGLLKGHRGTHNYTPEHASPEAVATAAPYWDGMTFERSDLVRDGHLITAQPWAYRKYAAEVARAVGALSSDAAHRVEHYVRQRSYDGA
ncbi:DJ-1/PfpI family protein [Ideonella livida]|uniref:DJ-1/PfpI domain-containing protein n=1 Tax=Ideonella livida TaxID=2707176 RepID=A0A7C9PKZ9_9BURK|nr:DJ-1/PfpI family protein [Ideonella livida]NDY94070.1 hypothetical protein [Ideonella livida]